MKRTISATRHHQRGSWNVAYSPALIAPPPSDTYFTSFAATENPLSEGGKWVNGLAVGLDWNNVQTAGGNAYGAIVVPGFDDDIAHLSIAFRDFAANQYAQATVHRAGGYSPSGRHEVELLLRFQITANNARGYEFLLTHNGIANIVRWNGPLGDYTALIADTNIGAPVDGDVLRAEITGGVVTVKKNGILVLTGPNDTSFADGQPGVGFWPKDDAVVASYGWKDFQAGDL